jgi:hypothetical protein
MTTITIKDSQVGMASYNGRFPAYSGGGGNGESGNGGRGGYGVGVVAV